MRDSRAWLVVGVLLVAGGLLGPGSARAQSLADVARAEEARRQTAPKSGKTYTNQDLRPDTRSRPTATAAPAPSADASAATATPPSEEAPKPAEPDAKRDEKYWRTRITEARERLERTKLFAEALQSRINALTTDFVNRDDPAQQMSIGIERQKALDELKRVQNEVRNFTKAIADIEEEARKAGAPPGWLR